jgi:hypothetical protein
VQIENEVIQLRNKNGNTFTGCVRRRGGGDTGAVSNFTHPAGAAVVRRKITIFSAVGDYTTYRDFEIFNSLPIRVSQSRLGTNDSGPGGMRGDGIDLNAGVGNHALNLFIHDAADGIFVSFASVGWTLAGNVVFNNGWKGNLPNDRPDTCGGHGQGTYIQNNSATVERIERNAIFNNFAKAKIFTTDGAGIDGLIIDGDVRWAQNVPPCMMSGQPTKAGNNLEIAVGSNRFPISNITVKDSWFYHAPGTVAVNIWIAGGSARINGAFTGNRIFGSHQGLNSPGWQGLNFSGNSLSISQPASGGASPFFFVISGSNYNWDRNTYYKSAATNRPFKWNGSSYDFTSFKTQSRLDASSIFLSTAPAQLEVDVKPDPYEQGRGLVVIHNPGLLPQVQVDLSALGLKNGDRFRVYKIEGWPSVWWEHTYNGQAVTFILNNLTVTQPIGLPAGTVPSTAPRFNTFIVKPCPCVW